jgi:glycine betaine/proline transport system substrate-binding protein
MRRLVYSAATASALLFSGAAHAACGDVSLVVFTWQSAEALSYVDQFILKNGYGCNVSSVAGDTVPTITSMAEKQQPDVSSETTTDLQPALVNKGVADGKLIKLGPAISDGEASGWFIPQYLAETHPDIKTVDDAMKHPELFPSPDDPKKGVVYQGPQGWGDTVVTAQLFKALKASDKGFVLVPAGSAAALDGAIARAYEHKQGFITQYWVPTSLAIKYPMKRLEMAHDEAEYRRCTTVQDCPDPKPNYWGVADMTTLVTGSFAKRPDAADAVAYLKGRAWTQAIVGKVMLWMTENQANGEDGAKWFLKNMPDVWTKWVSADVAAKVKAAL